MSYCRFSADNYRCDLYIYDHYAGGITIHVAGSRYVADTPIPEIPDGWHKLPPDEMKAAWDAQAAWIKAARMEPINLPHAGATFNNLDPDQAVERVKDLRRLGYNFPDFVLTALEDEAAAIRAQTGGDQT
jgi:hypothetical protein